MCSGWNCRSTGTSIEWSPIIVIASEATQSRSHEEGLDCFVAYAPRNDDGEAA